MPGPAVLQDILTGCQIQGNVDFGIQAAKRLIELRPHREGGYVLLSNVYATAGRWNDVAGMRILMTEEYSSDLVRLRSKFVNSRFTCRQNFCTAFARLW
ncbi:hypothetical protein V6Z11_D09G272700 [Gossypium hirsutum]